MTFFVFVATMASAGRGDSRPTVRNQLWVLGLNHVNVL